jgi:hypothetical protein
MEFSLTVGERLSSIIIIFFNLPICYPNSHGCRG